MFRLALSFLRIKASFLLPFSPPSLFPQYTMMVGDSGTALSRSNLYFFHVIHWQLGIPSAGAAFSACLGGAEVAAVREEGAAVSMPGLAGPRRVFTWQDRQTVQALGLSQSISCETSLCLSHRRLQRGCLDQLSRQHHQQLGKQHRQQLSRQHCQHPQVLLPQERVLSQHL